MLHFVSLWSPVGLATVLTFIQPHLLWRCLPKSCFIENVNSIWMYFFSLIINLSPFLPVSYFSPQLGFRLLVEQPRSFFQTPMLFLYFGISWGNGPQWLQLNYRYRTLVEFPGEWQFPWSVQWRLGLGKVLWDLKKSGTGNTEKKQHQGKWHIKREKVGNEI